MSHVIGHVSARWDITLVAASALLGLASTAQAAPLTPAAQAVHLTPAGSLTTATSAAAALSSPSSTGASGTASGQELPGDNELQSSLWQGNDSTLFPGESQTLTVTWNSADLQGATPVVSVRGWHVPKIDIPAS